MFAFFCYDQTLKGKYFCLIFSVSFACKIFAYRKRLCLCKTSMIKKKNKKIKLLLVKSFLDQGKVFACEKIFSRAKTLLMKETFVLVDKFFVFRKLRLLKTFFVKGKSLLGEKLLDRRNRIGPSLLKLNLYDKTNTCVEDIFLRQEQKLNLFLFFAADKINLKFVLVKILASSRA